MRRRDFFKGTAAGLATGSALSIADLLAKLQPKIVEQPTSDGVARTSDIGMFINGHRLDVLSIEGPSNEINEIDVTSLDSCRTLVSFDPQVTVAALLPKPDVSKEIISAHRSQSLADGVIRLSADETSFNFCCYITAYKNIMIGSDDLPTIEIHLSIAGAVTMT